MTVRGFWFLSSVEDVAGALGIGALAQKPMRSLRAKDLAEALLPLLVATPPQRQWFIWYAGASADVGGSFGPSGDPRQAVLACLSMAGIAVWQPHVDAFRSPLQGPSSHDPSAWGWATERFQPLANVVQKGPFSAQV